MKTQHTPGPWIPESSEQRFDCVLEQKTRFPICSVTNTGHNNRKSNARLIAAAPELLEALQTVFAEWCKVPEATRKTLGLLPHAIIDARAVIAKATGQ